MGEVAAWFCVMYRAAIVEAEMRLKRELVALDKRVSSAETATPAAAAAAAAAATLL